MLARLVLVVLGLLVAPPAAVADEVLTTVPGAERMSAYGGWLVISVRTGETRTLHAWHDGVLAPLNVRPSPEAFDHDVGPDDHGRPTVVYSRCLRHPRGCDLFALTLDEGVERRLTVSQPRYSEFAPAIWGDMLVFGRRKAGQRRADIVLTQTGKPWRRLPAGTLPRPCKSVDTCEKGRPQGYPVESDLGPQAVAYTWHLRAGNAILGWGAELRFARLDGGPARIAHIGYADGTCGQNPFAPSVSGLGVRHGLDGCGGTSLWRFELDGLRRFTAPTTASRLAWDGDTVYGVTFDGVLSRSDGAAWSQTRSGEGRPPLD
jgi:hypothetical protein